MITALALIVSAVAPLSGAKSHPSCAGAGPYWRTETLALHRGVAWVACKEQQRLVRVPLPSGRLKSVPLDGQPIAVVAAFGALWTLDTSGVISRVDVRRAEVTARISTLATAPYNLWLATARSGRSTTGAARFSASIRSAAR